uniref:ATPase AAA-type core domain-containing protein n=1 Tax=viral metagenome TaxID=1070528 RepID=A0A6C0E3F4_9ZZZZ
MVKQMKTSVTSKSKLSKKTDNSKNKKRNESSDEESDIELDSDSEWSTEDEEDEDNDEDFDPEEDDNDSMDSREYRRFLNKMFPSKHMEKAVKLGDKIKHAKKNRKDESSDSESSDDDEEEEEEVKHKKSKTKTPVKSKSKTSKKKHRKTKDESEDENDDDDDDDEENDKSKNVNIILTIGGDDNYEYIDDEDDLDEQYEDEFYETEDEDVDEDVSECSEIDSESDDDEELLKKKHNKNKTNSKTQSKGEKTKEKSNDKKSKETVKEEKSKDKKTKSEKTDKTKTKSIQDHQDEKEIAEKTLEILNNKEDKNKSDEALLKQLQEICKTSNSDIAKTCLKACEKKLKYEKKMEEKRRKRQSEKNSRIFNHIIHNKNTMNDKSVFTEMAIQEQKKLIKELREINKITRIEKPYRISILESNIPLQFKAIAMKKVNALRYAEPGSGEYAKLKSWIDTFMSIPFGNYRTLPVNISDGVEKCHEFMEQAQKTLNNAVYGLNDAKMQIMQMLGQLITNPNAIGSAIAIKGPMGTGKTSIVKEGISKILNRPFAFIALGGATDSSFLEGHSYTYEGSVWGKIVQIIIDSKCMNPVIYFDELDKISDTPKGEEIAGILTHLTDTSQNSQFHDKYFADIDFDLSKCLFIFSYNDESKVNPILRDRMYSIQTKGYDKKQKTVISYQYLLPKIQEQVKFTSDEIILPEESIHYIIENHCNKEDGVRSLKRCLEIIHTKLNLYRLMKPGSNLFEEDMSVKVEFPFIITKDIVDKLIKKQLDDNTALKNMYI